MGWGESQAAAVALDARTGRAAEEKKAGQEGREEEEEGRGLWMIDSR